MKDKGLELLSPAGNLDIFEGVVNAGADAVYFGGEKFGARAYAKNFSAEEAKKAIAYAHLHDCKAYLTLNTLIKNKEMETQMYEYLKMYYENGIDALIVQDMGVLEFVKIYFPDLPIHASTQMTVVGSEGANWLYHNGVSRVVTSRELSLEEIKKIHETTEIEIETFIHGALCVSYSGQCLMSSMLGGRSGNRGRCAQPCRLPYELLDDKAKKLSTNGEYLLSLKDLCGIQYIRKMAEAGVFSFKIEGRMKQYEYATGVVSLYRKYMDAYLFGEEYPLTKKDKKQLFDLGNRCGFTAAYLEKHNDSDMITYEKPSHQKNEDKKNEKFLEKKIPLYGKFYAKTGEPMRLEIQGFEGRVYVSVKGECVKAAKKQPTQMMDIDEKLKKTGATSFYFKEIQYRVDEDVFLPVKQINELRRKALDEVAQQFLKTYHRKVDETHIKQKMVFLSPPSNDKEVMVNCKTKEQFQIACNWETADIVALSMETIQKDETFLLQAIFLAKQNKKAFYLSFPLICRQETIAMWKKKRDIFLDGKIDGVLASSLEALGFLEEINYPNDNIQLDYRLYSFSDYGVSFWKNQGYRKQSAPLELNEKELIHRENASSQLLLYGRVALMVTANCQKKNAVGCDGKEAVFYLRDRYKQCFPVKNNCAFCYNEIYNSKIYNVLSEAAAIQKMGFFGYRLDFTLESARDMKTILRQYDVCFANKDTLCIMEEDKNLYTKGHFKRGVE